MSGFEDFSKYTRSLAVALHERDPYTRFHCERVDRLACEIGVACELTAAELSMLRIGASLHDIGKIGVPDSILLKPASYNPDERERVKAHSACGQRIVCATLLPHAMEIGTIIRHHHEYFDGTGYPDGLAGDDIPLLSRVLSIADSYDAMASPRVYQGARSHAKIMDVLHSEEGIKFDPDIFKVFTRVIESSASRAQLH